MSRVRDVVHARESKLAAAAAAVAAAQQQAAQQLALGQHGAVGGSAAGPFPLLAKPEPGQESFSYIFFLHQPMFLVLDGKTGHY